MAHHVELSGTAEWHEPSLDAAGILVMSPQEFERAVARVAAATAEPASHPRPTGRAPGRGRPAR